MEVGLDLHGSGGRWCLALGLGSEDKQEEILERGGGLGDETSVAVSIILR